MKHFSARVPAGRHPQEHDVTDTNENVHSFSAGMSDDDDSEEPAGEKGRLTARQRQVLEFIASFLDREGYPPTVRDIASCLSIVSLNAVRRHLLALERKGYIHVEPGKSRGIQLLDDPRPARPSFQDQIPIVGRVAAGPHSAAEHDIEGYMAIDPTYWGSTDELFLLRVKGNSMYPRLEDGDLVIVRRQATAPTGSLVVALEDNEATVKQLAMRGGKYFLHPLNPAYPDMDLGDRSAINGIVVGLVRKM